MQHVIIGGGPTGMYALDTIRKLDQTAAITLISDEPAYARMALPYYLAREIPEEQLMLGNDRFFQEMRVEARLGRRVTRIDPQQRVVTLDDASTLDFDTLLIATGSSPTRPAVPGVDGPGISTLWTLQESRDVLTRAREGAKVVFIGAGFIGFIVLNALHKIGCQLSVIEIKDQILSRMLDRGSAGLVERWLTTKGIAVYTGATVTEIGDLRDGRKAIRLSDGRTLSADLVIVATGIRPNTDLAQAAGIQVHEGILANDRLQTNFPFIYAGGDTAQGPDLSTSGQAIHAIQPTCVDHGRVAGANMAGATVHYAGSLLVNILDVAGLHCSSFGLWQDEGREATVLQNPNRFILRKLVWEGDRIVGALFLGPAEDSVMLNDLGMVKGLIQTKVSLGPWKGHLMKYPLDIRRPYVASRAAERLLQSTTVGRPSTDLRFRHLGHTPETRPTAAHHVMISTQPNMDQP
ncbi:MAG: NAD(P)/FAD-dependent oxidoreductase [Candidatus Methylomirabilales bacterium]